MRIYESESEWMDAFEAARRIAADPRNWTRTDLGQSLLGVARLDSQGRAWRTPDGEIEWVSRPPDGWIPGEPDQPWIPYPALARALQCAFIGRDARGLANTAIRLTPEIRVVKMPDGSLAPWKSLTAEVTLASAIPMESMTAAKFRDELEPYVRMWFPLRVELQWEWRALPAREDLPLSLLIRWYSEHFTSEADLAVALSRSA